MDLGIAKASNLLIGTCNNILRGNESEDSPSGAMMYTGGEHMGLPATTSLLLTVCT
jgi:hypothetical protein